MTLTTAKDSVEITSLRESGGQIFELDNGGPYSRYAGTIVSCPPSLMRGYECQIPLTVIPPPALVASLQDVTVYSRCVIETGAGKIVRESLINTGAEFGPFRRRPDGTIFKIATTFPKSYQCSYHKLVLLKQEWDVNYGHWLIETLPRVEMIAECFDLRSCCFLVGAEGGAIGQVYRQSLQLLGVSPDHILATPDEAFAFEELIYPTPITVQPWVKAPRLIRFLEGLAARTMPSYLGPSRIYIRRNQGECRQLLNEEKCLSLLEKGGYVVVNPSVLDFERQIHMFSNATHIVGVLGAGFSNVVFAPRGVQMLALTTEFMQDDFFWDLACQKNGCYTSLHGIAVGPTPGWQSDFVIDIDRFLDCFARFDPEAAGM